MSLFQDALAKYRAGKLDAAEAGFRKIVESEPENADACYLLGVVANDRRDPARAAELIGRAAALQPDVLHFQLDLGRVLLHLKRLDDAVAALRLAVSIQPDSSAALGQLGLAFHRRGDLAAALQAFRLALEAEPDAPGMLLNLGAVLHDLGRFDQAINAFTRAIQLVPQYANAHFNLGATLQQMGKLDDALAAYESALRIEPERVDVLTNVAAIFKEQGRVDDAIALYRRVVDRSPHDALCHSNLVYTMHFSPSCEARAVYDEARRWNANHAETLRGEVVSHVRTRTASARVRVGYVSPDFCEHAVGRFILPLLENHDRGAFEIVCYSDVRRADAITDRIRACADSWRPTAQADDRAMAELIRGDKIDVLIDLTMHMDRNRLPVFARKPAPLQATYLAYCGTTGLDAVDFRVSDPYLDPVEMDESIYAERTIRLGGCFWCYRPPASAPAVGALPISKSLNATFGCLNNFCKVNQPVLQAWSTLLCRLPGARLILSACEGSHRQRTLEQLKSMGVLPDRVRFVPPMPLAEYLRQYEAIDIALDPFPYNGGTTTCDALWMGVPVVSLAGETGMSRAGVSILTNAGLPELVARTTEQYVDLAAELANDFDRLAEMRSTLSQRMSESVLTDAPRFARTFENALRQMLEAKAL